jgi:glycosyltransferase involved in cell wall biosynthesis
MNHMKPLPILVIVPCYNESTRLDTEAFYRFSAAHSSVHFLFVDDGSEDSTVEILEELSTRATNVRVLSMPCNSGKGEAIRAGVLSVIADPTEYEYVGYLDADLSVPLQEIIDMMALLRARPERIFVMGVRLSRLGARIRRSTVRHYAGRSFATAVSFLLNLPIYDSQCGVKMIHKSLLQELFAEPFISRWLFDVELLYRLRNVDNSIFDRGMVMEFPLSEWQEVGGSKLTLKNFIAAPLELLLIHKKYTR